MTRVWVNTDLVEGVARNAAIGQNGIGATWQRLGSALAGSEGMAGNPDKDKSAAEFAPVYTRAVQAAWQGFAALHRSTGQMSKGLTQTAFNHLEADDRSTIGDRFSVVPEPRSFLDSVIKTEVSGPLNVPPPPSVTGPGVEPPKSLLETLTGIDLIDTSDLWPTGDSTALARASASWKSAHDSLIAIRGGIVADVRKVTEHSDAPDIDAFGYYWKKIYAPGVQSTLMEGLPQLCLNISRACGEYAEKLFQTRVEINGVAGNPIAALIAVAALRASLAAAATKLLQAVSAITAGVLADHIITSVTIGAAGAPDLRILKAELDDSVLREWQDLSENPPDPGDLEGDEQRIADDLGYTRQQIEDAIHAVKNSPGWRGLGENRNPDVVVDVNTGEVYPRTPSGVGEDSIGNIKDYLPRK
ncbi:hypothetical protein [Thermomonospora umbrina]|uniref:Outer membrane channel protein CpnT-like N-terminal domain-containing protein n=1 Tax=Thermomonospora umbrina TaxID=111806 RepID=A0A3D9SUL7_9ACTN|nr:hypothetical protein [Thermomonospora umbrina]REE96695.1 hypothetical protein DFJ69_2141 [Thermomonospora umbrina]